MYDYTLQLDFDAQEQGEDEDIHAYLDRRKRVWDQLEPELATLERTPDDPIRNRYAVTERTCRRAAEIVRQVQADPDAVVSFAKLRARLDNAATTAAEWFVLAPEANIEVDVRSAGVVYMKADRVKGRQPLQSSDEALLASQAWADFVRVEKLTGVELLWAPDRGRYEAPQWYNSIGTTFAGRGVDHPWFDPTTRGEYLEEGFLIVQPTEPQWIIGVRSFGLDQTRPDLRTDQPGLAELLTTLRDVPSRYGKSIQMPVRLLRSQLPDTDFAYLRVAKPPADDNDPHSTVRLCCTADVRRKLLDAKLAKPGDFHAIDVVDNPGDAPVFDDAPPPPGVFAEKRLSAVRKKVEALRAKFDAKPKPPRPVKPLPIAKLVPKLKRVLKRQGAKPAKGASPDALAAAEKALQLAVPPLWAELLAAVDGFDIDESNALDGTAELRIASAAELPSVHEGCHAMLEDAELDLPVTYLGVGSTDIGDRIFLVTGQLTPDGDCPVLHIDHETAETVMTWPAIGLFLADAIDTGGD